jgi:amidohydrolase
MLPSIQAAAGEGNVIAMDPITGSEDFSFFQREKPGIFIMLGGMENGGNPLTTPSHHTPDFYIEESGFKLGVRALSYFVVDYMGMKK